MKLKKIYVFLTKFLITEKYIIRFERFLEYNEDVATK